MDATVEGTPPEDRENRFAACLGKLEGLKAIQARREVVEERVFLECLQANRGRLNEFPLLETEQQSLMDMLLRRSEGVHPGYEAIRDLLTAYLVELNHYGKAKAVGDAAQVARLVVRVERAETVLIKVLQGAIYAVSLVKDNFSDAIIRHFGEASLAKIEEITATMVFDELYWRAYFERFIKEQVQSAYGDILTESRYRLSREGSLLLVAYPFDAVLTKVKGTTKAISQTRVQKAYETVVSGEEGRRVAEAVLAVLARPGVAAWARRADKEEAVFMARVATMDAVAGELAAATPSEPAGNEEETARHLFREAQTVALALGAAVSLSVARQDFSKALREFSPKEKAWLVQSAGVFEASRLGLVLEQIMEFDFAHLLREKGAEEGGRIQIKASRSRRVLKADVEALAATGLSKIRRKQLFENDPDAADYLLVRPRSLSDLRSKLEFLQIEPELAKAVVGLWENASPKVEIYVCINLAALDKVTTNLSARITEILGRYGIAQSASPESARTRRDA